MPSIPLTRPSPPHPSSSSSTSTPDNINPLPTLLQTPSGLALLELQGSVLSEQEQELSQAISLGHLVFPSSSEITGGEWDGKRVHLFVGKHQRMAGEVKKFGKAIAVVRRRKSQGEGKGEEVEIEEILRWKIVCGSRPEPMGAGEKIIGAGGGGVVEEEVGGGVF